MRLFLKLGALAFTLLAAGCAAVDVPTRAAQPLDTTPLQLAVPGPVDVRQVNVFVPRSLEVSEANTYLPRGDIVWRGDPPGDRYEQIQAIFDDGMTRGTTALKSGAPVVLDIEVLRFHALTEKTRYSVGGVHSMRFSLTVRDADTGDIKRPTKVVQADMIAFGGDEALAAEREGLTQKVRITDLLSRVISDELTKPGGYQNPRLGFIQILNHRAGSST